ncbi:hypothetical protein A3860_30505 [Niastella vici]|uniref:Glycosyltransferase RgtA/B/C/D-like domain-containing protein n=1 Tax=Niastella vici TaxID=1703345 RepID=A0A1V9FUN0_9BACT|nr:hypothetical protein [Niastella vici]OQP62017.1 hypothetical protein A3860_30505 [Niastella vici]
MEKQNSFKYFLLNTRFNKAVLFLAAIAILLQFTVFKYFYPYASFISGDSYVYLETAHLNLDINNYMVGYSRLLRLFSVFTRSDTALVAFQYLLIQSSALFFLFTLFFFYNPSKIIQIALICFIVPNPLFLYLANYISSDAYFLALSLIWFTILLWIIHRPTMRLIIFQTLSIYIAFTVRNNALIYPLIAAFAFIISPFTIKRKFLGIIGSCLVIGLFIAYTGTKFQSLTGTWQYSPFSGWQMANNAMYAYRYVDNKNVKPVPEKFRKLDNMIRNYFDSTRDLKKHPEEALLASTVYMWDRRSPLQKYMNLQFINDSVSDSRKKWASMGPLYGEYGLYIIKKYPLLFFKFFLWPNANRYFAPPVEFLEAYNMGKENVAPIAQAWFGYKSHKVTTRLKDFRVTLLDFYPILTGIMNVVFLCSLICFIIINGFRNAFPFRKGLLLAISVWIINAGFTIFASSAALRFQAFPILLVSTFALLQVDYLWKSSERIERSKLKVKNQELLIASGDI